MQSSEVVLINLSKQSLKKNYTHERLYRILYNPHMYIKAFSNIYSNNGSATAGIDGKTASNFSEELINSIIISIKDESYQPSPSKRVNIPKKNGKTRPLSIPSFTDRIVQEICRLILEAIYEPQFSISSHGFRPNKSCHTALMEIDRIYTGVNWFIEGDIKGFFDNIKHHKLIEILGKTIKDEKFLRLIRKFLKAGYIEDFKFNKTYTGTPQGGIISPILANIYLNELDKYILDDLKKEFDLGNPKAQQRNPVYRNLEYQVSQLRKKIEASDNEKERNNLILQFKDLKSKKANTPTISNSKGYKRLKYVRYADDFLIGVNGSKEDCIKLKQTIKDFLNQELELELSNDKTLITHSSKNARFLGYDISIGNNNTPYKNKQGGKIRCARRNVRLMMPKEVIEKFIVKHKLVKDINANKWMPICRTPLIRLSDLEIINVFNAEIRGIYNYYRLAENVTHKMWQLRYVMEYSCIKTLAGKHHSSVRKTFKKHRYGTHWGIKYQTKTGEAVCYFYNKGFPRNRTTSKNDDPDLKPNVMKYMSRTELEKRISAKKCEWCGKEDVPFEIHHVKRLKDVKGKDWWEQQMIARNRKTLVLCFDCHRKIAHGSRT